MDTGDKERSTWLRSISHAPNGRPRRSPDRQQELESTVSGGSTGEQTRHVVRINFNPKCRRGIAVILEPYDFLHTQWILEEFFSSIATETRLNFEYRPTLCKQAQAETEINCHGGWKDDMMDSKFMYYRFMSFTLRSSWDNIVVVDRQRGAVHS